MRSNYLDIMTKVREIFSFLRNLRNLEIATPVNGEDFQQLELYKNGRWNLGK